MATFVPGPEFRKVPPATPYHHETWERRCTSCGGRGEYVDVGAMRHPGVQFCRPCLGKGWIPCDDPPPTHAATG